MGFFSWKTSDTNRSISNAYSVRDTFKVYVLIPKEFGGGYIIEDNYEGYGVFGGKDIYQLLAQWNCPDKCNREREHDRIVGIHLKDAKYPIKITEFPMKYEDAEASENDRTQGYFYDDDLEEELRLREDVVGVLSNKAKELLRNKRVKPKLALESILKEDTNKLSSEEEKSSTSEISSLEIENNEEVGTPETPFENGVATMLNRAIVDEWKTIDEYNSILATISQNEENVPTGVIEIIQDIIAEELIHIGQLEAALQTISPNVIQIENGKLEAEEDLVSEEDLILKTEIYIRGNKYGKIR